MGNESKNNIEEENVDESEEDHELPVLRTSSRKRIRAHQDDSLFVYSTFSKLQNTDSDSS